MKHTLSGLVLITLLATSFVCQQVWALDCVPEDITFGSQSDVDDFGIANAGCTVITGTLVVNESGLDPIINLDSLAGVTTVTGDTGQA